MRTFILGLVSIVALAPAIAGAVTYPATTLIAGEMSQSVVSNQCYIVRGATEFQRNGGANKAYVTIAEMAGDGYQLNGRMNLAFSDAASGSVHFGYAGAYPSTIQDITFANYSQTYNATSKVLIVHFTLNFPNCALPVYATYVSS